MLLPYSINNIKLLRNALFVNYPAESLNFAGP